MQDRDFYENEWVNLRDVLDVLVEDYPSGIENIDGFRKVHQRMSALPVKSKKDFNQAKELIKELHHTSVHKLVDKINKWSYLIGEVNNEV